jgi:neutral ceramidase
MSSPVNVVNASLVSAFVVRASARICRSPGRCGLKPALQAALLACACLIALFGARARAADAPDADWSVGVATVKITPPKPVPLAGYAARTAPYDHVDQDVYATALALRDSRGGRGVLVTMDLCIFPREVGNQVRERIEKDNHLDPAAVVLNVAHSHSAPDVSLDPRPENAPPTTGPSTRAATAAATVEYTRWLQDRLVEVAAQALQDLRPARLSWGSGVANFAMNRRQFTDKGVILGANPRGPVDRTVPVLRIDSAGEQGKLIAVVFGYACHNTTIPSKYLGVSGDYAGHAKAYVQRQFPGAAALFVAGCGGDADPYPRQHMEDAAAHGEELGKEVCRVLGTKLTPVRGPLTCAQVTADLPLQTPSRDELNEILKSGPSLSKPPAKQMLATLDGGGKLPPAYTVPVGAWQLGPDLTLVALPDEVVVEYVQRLTDAIGPTRLWVAGYCNEVTGYVPSKRILREGGYETRGLYFDAGWFAPGVEDVLTNAAAEAARKAGRQERLGG